MGRDKVWEECETSHNYHIKLEENTEIVDARDPLAGHKCQPEVANPVRNIGVLTTGKLV